MVKDIILDFQERIEKRIAEISAIKEPLSIYEPFNYIMSGGGKRIRPLLVLLSCGAVGGNPEIALDSAVAVEVMHNYTLVHDDIMDNSPMRRNRETIHKKWNETIAILTGDLMLGIAFKLLPKNAITQNSDLVRDYLAQVNIDVCEGQALDIDFNSRKDIKIDDYLKMINYKTAKLLSAAVKIGGTIGGGTLNEIKALENYATNLGIGFQIQDDVLDLTADEKVLGKTIGLDIIEGKKTALILKSIELAQKEEHKLLLNDFLNNNGADSSKIPQFIQMMKELNIFDYATNIANDYFNKAEEALKEIKNNIYKEGLINILKMLSKREK